MAENQPEVLAQHYAAAGLAEKSVGYWARAGQRSVARSAMAEAATQLRMGLEQLALLPVNTARQRQELELLCALGAVLQAIRGLAAPEAGNVYARARSLWEQLGSPSEFLQVPFRLSIYRMNRGELDLAQRLGEDLLRLSSQSNDGAGLVMGHACCGWSLGYLGRFASSRSHLEEVLALYDPISHCSLFDQTGTHLQAVAQAYLGIVLFCLGYPEQALVRSNSAIAEARRFAHPRVLALSLALRALPLSLAGDFTVLAECADQLCAVATELGFPQWRAEGTIYKGWVKANGGYVAEGISLLRSGSAAFLATRAELWMPYGFALFARALEIAGEMDEAVAQSNAGLEIVEKTGARWLEAELNRHKGQLLLQRHTEVAEELYRKALSIAQEQEAKLWELRAATSLARLWRDQGKHSEARDLLAPVYGWFTEGFDTPDLKEARALLGQL